MTAAHPPAQNRLASQTSPYLLQHARNPVDWYPWGEEAFTEARRRDVPIFLSIGYSTCYWCHVMERESFESDAIAAKMNEKFVCVKVDREERPDVDDLYMAAVQAFSGSGGWPMSVFLEPKHLRPFWAGTYFPAEPRFAGMPTFPSVLDNIAGAWAEQRQEVLAQAEELADAVRERVAMAHQPVMVNEEHVSRAVGALLRMFDRDHGGFGGGGGAGSARGPKFPQAVFIELLLDARRASADDTTTIAIDTAIRTTLDRMARGGINDQVGGGFHRYSVDRQWIVPHFEKMLYDNAQLMEVYAKAAVVYGDAFYRRTAIRTAEYVLREMTDPATGAFFSAQDAEVNHREGQNYIWTRAQIDEVLDANDAKFAATVYGVDRGPNFRDPHHPGEPMTSVLTLIDRPESLATTVGVTEPELIARLDRVNQRLYAARETRDQPLRDDKSLASWNGMMIRAMATCGMLLNEPRYLQAATRAAGFVLTRMRDNAGDPVRPGLLRSHRAGKSATPAFLEDYAMVIRGLAELHRTGTDSAGRFLGAACDLCAEARRRFGAADGGFYDTMAGQGDLFVRARSNYDGAVPGGAGEMVHGLLDLAEITGEPDFRARAVAAIVAATPEIAQAPTGACNSVRALMRIFGLAAAEFDAALAEAAAGRSAPVSDDDFTPVEIFAATDRVEVGEGWPASLMLRVRIADAYHLNAADPSPGRDAGGLVPFRVHIINGGGVAAYADYPVGEPYGKDGELRIYRGTLDLQVALAAQGAWSGRPLLAVTFQPCADDRCLAPRTVELDLAIDLK